MPSRHILVVGCGSVGKRHAANLQALGCRISGVDPSPSRLEEASARVRLIKRFSNLESALEQPDDYDAVVIASPPSLHVSQGTSCLASGLPMLLEKPVAPTLDSARALLGAARASALPVLVGYTFRWWAPIHRLKALLEESAVGRVLRVHMVMAAHLADWHPRERYQDFFMARAALGGGALLDESHFLDLMLWLFEWPRDLCSSIERLSSLEIDTDDNVEVSLGLPSGGRVVIHLDLYSRPHERSIRVFGEEGTLEWNNEANHVRSFRTGRDWEVFPFTCERNDMFVDEARHFLRVLEGSAAPMCTLLEGCRVVQLIEAIRDSHARRCTVHLPPALVA